MKINKTTLMQKKPAILLAVGIASGLAATVWACKQTLKLKPIIDDHKEKVSAINETKNSAGADAEIVKVCNKNLAKQYAKTAGKVVVLYSGPAVLGAVSVASVTGSFFEINGRYKSALTGYAAYKKLHEEYRSRVSERFGEEVEEEIRTGCQKEEVEVTNPETGEVEKKTITKVPKEGAILGEFAYLLSPETSEWMTRDSNFNYGKVKAVYESYLCSFHAGEMIFVNDVRRAYGLKPLKHLWNWGWQKDIPGCPQKPDFGIYRSVNDAFREGYSESCWLDMNPIWVADAMPESDYE